MRKSYLKYYALLLALAMIVGGAACSREAKGPVQTTAQGQQEVSPSPEQAREQNMALVRVVNAIPDRSVDLLASDQKAFDNVAYKSVTPYKMVPEANDHFKVQVSGQEGAQPLAENTENLAAGKHYTVIALPAERDSGILAGNDREPEDADRQVGRGVDRPEGREAERTDRPAREQAMRAELLVIDDNLAAPAEGKARIRVINAVRGMDDFDVFATNIQRKQVADRDANEAQEDQDRASEANRGTAADRDKRAGDKRTGNDRDNRSLWGGDDKNGREILSNVSFRSMPDYEEVDAMSATLEIRGDDYNKSKHAALRIPVDLEAGKIYTLVVTGQGHNLDVVKLEDQVIGQQATTAQR